MLTKKNDNIRIDDDDVELYEVMREAISALTDIIKINFDRNDFFYQVGLDNLNALHASIIALSEGHDIPSELKRRSSEMDLKESNLKKRFCH